MGMRNKDNDFLPYHVHKDIRNLEKVYYFEQKLRRTKYYSCRQMTFLTQIYPKPNNNSIKISIKYMGKILLKLLRTFVLLWMFH